MKSLWQKFLTLIGWPWNKPDPVPPDPIPIPDPQPDPLPTTDTCPSKKVSSPFSTHEIVLSGDIRAMVNWDRPKGKTTWLTQDQLKKVAKFDGNKVTITCGDVAGVRLHYLGSCQPSSESPLVPDKVFMRTGSTLRLAFEAREISQSTPEPTPEPVTNNVPPIIVKNGRLWCNGEDIEKYGTSTPEHPYPPPGMRPPKKNEVHGEVYLPSVESHNRYVIRGYIASVMHLNTVGSGKGTVQIEDNLGNPTKWWVQ